MDIKQQGELLRTVANRHAQPGKDHLLQASNNLGEEVDTAPFHAVENQYLPLGDESHHMAPGNRVIHVPASDLH